MAANSPLLFVKEKVPDIRAQQTTSLLSSSLGVPKAADATSGGAVASSSLSASLAASAAVSTAAATPAAAATATTTAAPGMAPIVAQHTSALTASLAAAAAAGSGASNGAGGGAGATSAAGGASGMITMAGPGAALGMGGVTSLSDTPNGFQVHNVIAHVLAHIMKNYPRYELPSTSASGYELHVADENGSTVDADFPELDGSVMIESVGVTQFVLCDARNTNVVLRVELPNEIMQMAQQHRHVLNTLDVLCHHPKYKIHCIVKVPNSNSAVSALHH